MDGHRSHSREAGDEDRAHNGAGQDRPAGLHNRQQLLVPSDQPDDRQHGEELPHLQRSLLHAAGADVLRGDVVWPHGS